MTASALLIAGLVTAGSATNTTVHTVAPQAAPEALLAAAASDTGKTGDAATDSTATVGLVPAAPEAPRKLSAMTPPAGGGPLLGGTVPLHDVLLPGGTGVLGIPELVLAAYRNAELALQSSQPNCHLPWYLLAGIGRIESNHANNGRTDAAGTTTTPIYGPALDGTLPGNEIIKAADGGYVRAVGPMQFLPSTWSLYASNGKGSGTPDPNNIFDAALTAGKYLCSGGLDLSDPAQELKAVLRYNNSTTYAANVLSWANAYKTGGTPTQVTISPDLVPGSSFPMNGGPDISIASSEIPATTTPEETTQPETTQSTPTQTEVMITIPGLPPIPCGIFCPAPEPMRVIPCDQSAAPDADKQKGDKENRGEQNASATGKQDGSKTEQTFGPDGKPVTTDKQSSNCAPAQQEQTKTAPQQQAPQADTPATEEPAVTKTPEPGPAEQAPEATAPATQTPAPGITLPFGITIPLPAPAQ